MTKLRVVGPDSRQILDAANEKVQHGIVERLRAAGAKVDLDNPRLPHLLRYNPVLAGGGAVVVEVLKAENEAEGASSSRIALFEVGANGHVRPTI